MVPKGADSVDFKLVNAINKYDIVSMVKMFFKLNLDLHVKKGL